VFPVFQLSETENPPLIQLTGVRVAVQPMVYETDWEFPTLQDCAVPQLTTSCKLSLISNSSEHGVPVGLAYRKLLVEIILVGVA
jgi:hypothetical protein